MPCCYNFNILLIHGLEIRIVFSQGSPNSPFNGPTF
jgi:hypothetical protein